MKKTVKGNMTIYTAEYGDTHDYMGKEYPSPTPPQDIDLNNIEVKDSFHSFHLQKRERLKHCLLQLRCFLGDDEPLPSDAQIDAMPFQEVEDMLLPVGRRLDALWEKQKGRQQEREKNSFERGVKQYMEHFQRRKEQGQAIDDAPGEALIRKYAEPLKDAIIDYTLNTKSGRAAYYAESVRFISALDPAVAAYITTRIVLANCFAGSTVARRFTDIHDEVTKWVEAEALAEDILTAARRRPEAEYQRALQRHAAATTAKEREAARKQIARWKKKLEIVSTAYSAEDRDRGGLVLIKLLLESNPTTFFKTFTTIGKRTYTVIAPTPRLEKEMQQAHLDRSKLFPVDRAMIYPPFPWENVRGHDPKKPGLPPGGYRFDGRKPRLHGPVNMIKTTEKEGLRRLEDVLLRHDGAETIMGTVNALQGTPFRINRNVFDVMDAVVNAENYSAFKLPELRAPADTAPYMERLHWWRTGQAKASVFSRQYRDAKDDLKEPILFFPHTFDFRGRVYPMGGPLNPQGDDRAKALLEFAEGRRMGEHPDAGKWLAIHGANCWGLDKESIKERLAWINDPDNRKSIIDAAGNPLDYRWWLSAEKPWPFLAFCFEWAQYLERGADHITHLPVFVDGTCNGSQHMAALMRCKATGRLVGLCKAGENEKPADLYQTVADAVNAKIDADVKKGNPDAIRIREIENAGHAHNEIPSGKPFAINRRLAKGPVMTYGYGITERGMRDGISETFFEWRRDGDISNKQWAILCPKRDPEEQAEGAGPFWKTVTYLANAFEKAIEEKAVASGRVMKWLKAAAETAAARPYTTKNGNTKRKGMPVTWLSPVGFPVYYAKYTKSEKRLQCYIFPNATAARRRTRRGGHYAEVTRTYYDKSKIHIGDTGRGLPPDLIHSLDAAHMMKTIDYCQRRGIRSFAMIHDSYGTHAPTMAVMAEELRRAFLDIYKTVDIHWIARSLQKGSISVQVAELEAAEKNPKKTTGSQEWFNYYVPEFPDVVTTDTLDINDVLDATYFFA